ncbi:15925_t:CDS:1, partial [Cetraspora pellucida]
PQLSRPNQIIIGAGPTSSLPSQFNIQSPSAFLSEFYRTAELSNPIIFDNTHTSANPGAFPWPDP